MCETSNNIHRCILCRQVQVRDDPSFLLLPTRDMLKLFGMIVGVSLALALLTASAYRVYAKNRAAEGLVIRTANGIDESGYVRLGGVEQWVQIRGEDRAKPVVLVLHGGPGMSYMPFTALLQSWERDFIVVQWDRRGV